MEQALTNPTTGLNLNLKPLFPSKPLEKTQLGSVSFTRLGKPLIGALDYHSIKDHTPDQVHNHQSITEERLQIQAQDPEQMIITPEMPQDYDLEDADIENMVFEPQIILDDSNPDDYIDDTNDTNDAIENDQGDIEEGDGEFIKFSTLLKVAESRESFSFWLKSPNDDLGHFLGVKLKNFFAVLLHSTFIMAPFIASLIQISSKRQSE